MELECDLSKINNEELLRKMWQQSEDASRKKEIRSQLYKLRESRLRDLYQGDIMADNSGFGKDPLATSHGDALADQSFQSLKSKEIRDSLSPTEMKFQSMALNNPNTTGWNVQSSKEVSPDGRGFRAETVATTDGVESINGGTAEFKGRNEQRSSAHHQGDDKNFVKQAMESSNSHLQEKVVIGDENCGRTEVRTSSSKSTSSSQVFQSSSNVEYDDGFPRHQPQPQKYLMDSSRPYQHDLQQQHQQEQQRLLEEQRRYEQQFQQQRQQHHNQQERHTTEQLSTTRQNTEQKNISQNVQTQETHEQNKRYVDMDKASPEYQQHVQYLMQQPGEIISNTVEYPKPNVKMITTVKRLPDGTIVRNKRYETEEVTPTTPTTRTTSTATNQTQPRRDSQQQPSRNYPTDSAPHSRPSQDMVDSSNTSRYVQDTHTDDVETKFSSVKKSSSKFSTQTTSETVQEFDDRYPQGEPRPKPVTNDFSTQGFPSVRSNKPTQEYPTERPHTQRPTQGFPSQGTPSKPTEAMVPHYTDATDNNITERRVNTKDGEVIIVSSEKKRNYKTSTNSERIVETEHVIRDDQPYQQIPDKSQDYTTHGFPSAREPAGQQPKNYPSDRQMQPHEQDFPLDKFSPGPRIVKPRSSPHGDDDVVVVSSQKSRTAKYSTNTERVIEHEIIRDDQPSGYPRIQPSTDNSPYNYTVTTPGEQKPQAEFPGTPRKPNNVDYSTQGFPSVRTPGQTAPGDREPYGDYPAGTPKSPSNDYSTHGYPSATTPSRPAAGLPSSHKQHPSQPMRSPSQEHPTQGFPSVRTPTKGTPTQGYPSNVDGGRPNGTVEQPRATPTSKTQPRTPSPNKYKAPTSTVRETTERVIRKEKEVDSAHRAFAASLRSSSPIDHVRRDSYTTDSHTRHTPRSSVSSTKTFRRDMREGSHDSAPSETSRISTTTITRNTPPRTVGGRTVVTKVVTTKTNQGSNDTLNVTSPRATKSPSPGKTVTTTTTTTRTMTSKDVPKVTGSPDNQHTRITTNNIDTILFPINEKTPPLTTTITKIKFSDNHKQLPHKKPNKLDTNISKKKIPELSATTPPASAVLEEVIEPPCIKKHYSLLGPSDQLQAQSQTKTSTSQPLKSPPISEKSPTKKPQPQPAPSSRSSTPSYNSRKPPTSEMTDDYDDADKLKPTSPLSPSSRSRTPQKIGPNDNDKPQDDWQTRPQPDNDERRTVNRETTFEKDENVPAQPRKPNYEQPNVEWVIVDDGDDYDHDDDDDNDSFAPEVVDSKLNVKKTTLKLITQEKQTPVAPQRRPKPTTTTTVITKQTHTIPSYKPQTKPNDRSPLKIKPGDSRTPQQVRPQKPLTDSKSPVHAPLRGQPKVVDNKQMPKGPKSTAPSYTPPLRKPLPKTTTEETTLRKTLKTSQVIKEKTNKLIEAEKPKRTPQSPERKPKSQTPGYKVTVTEVTQKRTTPEQKGRKPQGTTKEPIENIPYETDDEPVQGRPSYKKPHGVDNEPDERIPGFKRPVDTDDEPHQGSPGYRKPYDTDDEPHQGSPSYRKPYDTDDEPHQGLPGHRKPYDTDEEPNQHTPGYTKPQKTGKEPTQSPNEPHIYDEPIHNIPGYRQPQETQDKPTQGSPGFRKPQNIYEEPNQHTPGYRKPQETGDKPNQETPGFRKPQSTVEEPKKGTSTPRKPPSPGFKRLQDTFDERSPDYKKPVNFDDEPNQGSPIFRRPQGTNDEPSYRIPGSTKPQDDDDDFEPNRPGYEKPKRIVEEQITITETSEERYPEREAPKRPDTKPNQYSPNRYPQDTDYEPGKRTPGDEKPYDEEPYHTSRKPYDTDDEPSQYIPGHGKPYDQEPNQSHPGFRQPVYKDNEPNQGTPTFKKPLDSEPKEDLPHYLIPQQVIEEEITITETSQKRYPDKETPQGTVSKPGQVSPVSRKPHDMGDRPSQGKPGTPGRVNPNEEPTTPSYRKQPQKSVPKYTRPGDKPLDDDECITESVTTSSQKTVAKHIQKFETNLNKKSPKPQPRTKSPTKELPQTQKKTPKTPLKETSPTRSETKPKVGKPRSDKPFEIDEDEIFVETNEFIINSTQKQIVSEKQILEEEESTYPSKHPKKPTREVSPTGNQRKPSQKYVEEPADKHPKTPKHVSPTRTPQKSTDDECFETTLTTKQVVTQKTTQQLVDEYPKYPDQKTLRGISPTRNLKKPEEPTGKRPQSPNKNVSPTRQQKQPEQKSPTKPTDGRPKSPSKHVSPTRTEKKPHEKTPLDDVQYTTTLQTTKIVREKITKDDEEYPEKQPKNVKPMIGEPRDTDDDETFIETSELITNSTQKRIVSEKQITTTEESIHPGRKAPKIPTQNKPGQKSPEEPLNRRSQSPTKPVSPTRTQKKPGQTTPVDDQTFRKTLRTTETITEKLTKKVDGKEYPKDKMPTKKGDKPEQTKPKGQKPHSDHPSDTEEDETITETTEFVINTTNKRIVTEQDIHEFPDNKSPKYPDTQKPKSPTRGVSPIRKQPGEQQPEGRPKEPTGKRPQSPNRHVSPTRTQKKPNEKTPVDDDETFTASYTTTKIVKEKLTKKVDDKEYPEEEFPSKNDDKPEKSKPKPGKPYSDQPSDTEEDETVTETSEFIIKSTNKRIVTEQNIQEFEEPQYPDNKTPKYPVNQKPERVSKSPTRGVSPTRKPTGEQKPEERLKEPTGRRPQSPNKHVSPTRTQKKPVDDDETFTTSYTTTKIVTKKVDGKEYPEEEFPSKKDDKPEKSKPKPGKPYSDQPSDTEEDETVTETSEFVIKTTNKRIETEQNIQEFEEPRYPGKKSPKYPDTQKPERVSKSPTRGVSPTRKQPGQQQPEPIGRRPQSPNKHVSPTRTQKKPNEKTPVDNVETFTTTKIVKEKMTKETGEDKKTPKPTTEKDSKSPTRGVSPTRTPKRPGQKLPEEPDLKEPTGKRPLSPTKPVSPTRNQRKPIDGTKPRDEPLDSEEYETFTTTSEHVINTKRHMVTEKITSEFEKPKSPTRGISPTRTQKKPGQKLPEEPDFKEPTGKRPQSPTRAQKKPGQQTPTEPIGKRPQSPTRTTKKPINEDETYKTTLKTTKTVTEKTMYVDDEEYPDEETPYKRGDKPDYKPKERKPYSDKPSDTEEDETITETSERFISSKTCKVTENLVQEFEEPESPIRGVSPTRTQKKPGQKTSEEPDYKEPIGKTPQSPTRVQKKPGQSTPKEPSDKRPQSPTRTQKKPTKEDETFKSTLRTTKTVTEKTTKYVEDEEYPEEKTPYKKGDKPDDKPEQRNPKSDEPCETDEEEFYTETISSKTSRITKETMQEFDRPKSPSRGVSPTQKRPGQESETTGKRPQSPTRNQKLPYQTMPEDEQTITETWRTTKIIKENVTKTFEDEEFPEEKRPKSPKKDLIPDDDDQTFTKTLRTTKTITEKTTEDTPYGEEPRQSKPKSYKPTETDGDKETFMQTTEFVIKSTHKPEYPDEETQPKYVRPGFEKPKDKRVVHTNDFIRTEKQTLETEKQLLQPVGPKGSPSAPNKQRSPTRSPSPKDRKGPKDSQLIPKDRKDSPTRSPSPQGPKSGPKSTTVDDETFRKTLRTTEIFTDKTTKTKPDKIKPKDRKPEDDEETTSETEEYLIETCEKRYVTSEKEDQILSTTSVKPKPQKPSDTKPQEKEPLQTKPKTQQPSDNEPETGKPVNKPFTSTYVETVETIEGQTYPEDLEQFPDNKKPYSAPLEPWLTEEVPKRTTKVNEQFIETERIRKETPDGSFISKTTEPTSPTTPTYKKKGTGRSDTFEERCRQILGMETYGDTPGTFKKQPITETEEKKTLITKDIKTKEVEDIKATTVFQVKIEDCDEDDEPLSINSVKKTLHKQIHTKEQNEPLREEPKSGKKPFDEPETKEPQSTKKPVKEPKYPKDDENEFVQTITETTTIHKKTPKTKPIDKTEPDSSEPETVEQHFVEINKETKKSEVKIIKKSSPTSSPRSVSPTKSTTTPRTVSPTKPKSSPRNESPLKETPKRKPSKDTLEPKTTKTSPQKPGDDTTTTIKDRLRSSTRKTKSPGKQDQVDGSDSSPERSPNRGTERRRSSNISVTTEIIIEHTDSDTPNKKEKSPVPKKPKDSVYKEIIDSTVLPEKLTRRMLVTERKESAPVHRVTNKDKDSKMSRSTSENLIKVKKPEPQSLSPKTTPKTTDHRRPNKCFATKSINLSATDRLVNSEDMENVIIDIQHAKSSREPSPDKIVPTPVPAHLDTGKPRYPDVVQEPEDDQPRRKPQVKNIPIFEEESNAYVGCHITEVERTHKTTYDSLDYEEQILNNPVVEAPPSLDYPSLDKPTYDESLLTVHEKVSKFQNIAEEVSKPKASEPFQREFDDSFKVPEDDECLLTINEKVEKFVKTSERVNEPKTKSPYDLDDEDEEFARNERIYTSVKLAPSAPQKSPELVRTISRHISRQNEPDSEEQQPGYNDNEATEVYPSTSRNDDFVECLVNNKKITKEFEVSHHQQQQQKAIETTLKTAEKYQQPKDHDDDDDDELIPHTATHTTKIEERRQKDILSRPSVFDSKNKKPTTSTTTTTITTSKTPLKCNKSPVKDSEKLRPDIKSRTKPTSAVTNTITETTTATTTTANKQPKQSPQRKNSDIDYELRGSGVETGVRNIISKQTKVYNSNNIVSSSGSTKTNDLKKPNTSNKKPEKHMPVRLTPAKNSDEYDLSADDDEMIITCDETKTTTTETNIDFETQVVNEDLTQETTRKIPLTTPHKNQPTPHSSTNSSTTDQSLKFKTKEHVENLTERNPLKPNTVTTTSIKTTYETVERPDDIDETVLEPTKKKPSSSPHPNKTTKMSTTITDSVAARRSLFESNHSSPSATPTKRTPLTSPMTGRRPSYMDHTKSSLEHTRRDSLEINKTNYSRKPSHPEEEGIDRNSLVKFDVPQGKRATTPRATSVTEDINVEEIFDLEVLEKLLETVQSYEIRRRIRAQIRLIKKNQKNEMITSTTEVTTKTIKTSKVSSEEPDTVTTTVKKTKPETKTTTQTVSTEGAKHVTSSKKEYIFDEPYMPTTRRSPKPNRYTYEPEKEPAHKPTRSQSPQSLVCRRNTEHERHYERTHHSPEHRQDTEVVREYGSRTTKQQYYYKDEQEHEQVEEITHETSPTRKSPSPTRKPHSIHSSPERRNASPDSHKPLKTNERSRSPQTKAPHATRVTSSRSPDNKTSTSTLRKSSATYEQQETVKSSTTKPQTKRITTTTTTITKSKPEDKTPVWADRKNILKAPSSTTPTPKKPSTSTLDSRSGYTKTVKSTTSQRMSSNKSSFMDDDCVTSSYGIGPTDENGLPLFGIRALKKKKPTVEPSETTEEVTGYVVEEKYYSDNKTKPSVERKEFIYSTNPEELQKLKEQVEVSSNRKALKDVEVKESRQTALISKGTPALRSSPEDDFLDSTSKYVRRGSVKEMSEKFIQREGSSTVTEKSNNYPKAGLILRTNSRKNSRDAENENEHFESYKTTRVQQQHTSTVLADSDDAEYEVEEVASRHSGRFITESESECDSIKTQREFKKVTSSSSSSMATRSFLNTQGEEKVITNVSDCLERMRNADNVVEEGDTPEDQEARALLNKFLGASIIMKGVESSLPGGSNRQSKIITTTTTSSNLSDDNDGDNNAKHEVKTTRITKTIKSGSSSTPVTYTTCDIEEIWDEEILKELLEQARTYEERRKIRSRLRELMADREETKKSPTSGDEKEVSTVKAAAANVPEEEESSASEYEEIIEEVTDYSEAESEVDDKNKTDAKVDKVVVVEKSQKDQEAKTSEAVVTEKTAEKSVTVTEKLEISCTKQETRTEQVEETTTQTTTEEVEEVVEEETSSASKDNDADDKTDSSEKGESLQPMVHDKKQNTPQTMPQEGSNSSHSNQSTNSQKLKSAQTQNSNSKTTGSESSSMHAPYNNKSNKTQKQTSTAPTSSQNPIVTVQTAGRADSTSISNKSNNKNSSSSRQTNSNNSNTNLNVNDNDSSSSLGGSSVVVGNSDSPRQVDRLGVPQKEDSGTESGEDLRLIAAGLRDQLQIQSDSNIIEDVTCALSRLENSLKEGKDISVDTEKRKALLALVARLRAGLTSPEKLAEIAAAMSELDGNEGVYGETSSPEADAHRSNRSRFAKRRNRVNRHTVGVSREELADARRYMEDMLIMGSISQSTTPEANSVPNNSPPQWYPLEKNASSGAILTQSSTPVFQRPKEFVPDVPEGSNVTYTNKLTVNNGKRRPLSGEYSVTFENPKVYRQQEEPKETQQVVKQSSPPEDSSKISRFTNKKHLMKRANTIDLSKAHKYNSEFDTDSDAEDKGPHLGLKRAVQVSVKKRVQNVVPPFEPKTENDRKFLAFINKQSDKPGLGWTTSRSVSNWTNKFGSIKSTFEGGLAGKPPQAPHHVSSSSKPHQSSKLFSQPMVNYSAPAPQPNYITNQQIALRLQQEAERQAEERRRKLERERLEFERRERDKLERQRQQREMQERERLEREHFERQRREQDKIAAAQHAAILREQEQLAAAQHAAILREQEQLAAAQHAAILREQEQLAAAQQAAANMNVPKPIPINEFKHAPQSVFRPIDNVDSPTKPIYKPIPQLPRNPSNWQSLNTNSPRGQGNSLTANSSPNLYGNTKPDNSFITSPPPSSRSPIGLPWASKPTVDNSSFKSKAHRFEERSKYDNINSGGPFIQRHNSLRSANGNHIPEDFRKRPSLPNTCDPYSVRQMPPQQDPLAYLPPPQNISFTYSNLKPKTTYQSYPCLPSAVVNNSSDTEYQRPREDSLTDPHSVPLVLTSSNPSYCPPPQTPPQLHQPQMSQLRMPKQFDLVSPADSTPTSPSIYTMPQTDCTDDDLDSDCNLLEYHAVSRVMGKPQSQTAVTVGRRTGHVSDDELYGKNSKAAKNLLSTMKSLGNSNGMTKPKVPALKRPEAITSPKTCLSPDGRSYQAPIVEPLFPEINKFEANRQPLYNHEIKKQTTAPTYSQPAPRKQLGMYKSMENLNRNTSKNLTTFMGTTTSQQQPSPKPYVSETQTSYVVTYPVEDTTDDEDFSRISHKKVLPPSSLDLRRQRNVSENSTGSSTTASMSYSQNLPSPNTSWTSNPIVVDESSNYQSMPTPYQNPHKNLPPSPAEPSYQALSSQVVTSYSNVNQNANYNPPPADYIKTAAQYEAPPQRQMPAQQQASIPVQQQAAMPNYGAPAATQLPTSPPTSLPKSMPTTKSSYEAKSQRQLQLQQQHQQQQYQNTTNQTQSTTKSSYGAQTQQQPPVTQHQAPEIIKKPPVTQKPTDYTKSISKTTTKTATSSSTSTTQEKRSLASMRKTVSEDHHSIRKEQTTINPQHSNISEEMITRLDQQRERISNDIRRKSLGNALDYQMEKQARYETQNSQEYKSSAPADTPDIVKSSLPKDENQPILKKFGPPQRHHYMPNAYQSPSANTTTSSTVVATATHNTKIQGKDVHTMSNQTVVKTQQIVNHTKPTVMETPATPQPDDDYIPRNIVYNNVHAFTSMNRRQDDESTSMGQEQHQPAVRPNKLSKSDSWNQIVMMQNQHVPTNTTKFNQSPTNELRRTKSGHTLALPKMYEAAMTKTDISEKQKTVAAYFSGQKSPTQQETVVEQQTTKRSVINRTKTSEKVSAASRKSLGSNLPIAPGGLQRSATMPHIANLNLLDESNVEDAFEQLMMEQKQQQKSSTSTTEKTETKDKDGAVVTTTTKVTTRTVTGSAAKPASPFAKFKQLDRQNSQQSAKSPTTPTTPGGGSTASPTSGKQPIFKFTDPALNAKAATVKEQLLQWCQSKTQEYENIEITNFSTSWNNGLAFCALIHHFLPDAFDYSQLTPKNRRKNFELAFTVADEKAGIAPLLDVEDMVVMQRPDWKCVFVYVQSIYRRFRNCQ